MIEFGRVIAVDWKSHTVDLIMSGDGRSLQDVRVMSSSASSDSGLSDLPKPGAMNNISGLPQTNNDRSIIAVVAFYNDLPVVIGFLHPQASQLRLKDEERMMNRHASDVYQTIDKDGNFEFAHPSGAYIRIGTTSAHENLAAKSYGEQWKIKRNTDKQVHLHIEQAGGKATLDIAPDGAITITTATTVSVNATGNATVVSGGNAEVNAVGKATINASEINLNGGGPMKGIVQGDCVCAFTGMPHGQVSATVKASA
ncbi:MAG: hypothetical protein K2P67_07135 [Gallionellaceae bacterium]|nr:hypothetical protein [Gallionellaceae bacterium]